MEGKYFMHRIRKENGQYTKGIEVHDTLDSAVLSWHGQMKLASPSSSVTFVSAKVTDGAGNIVKPYDGVWISPNETDVKFFMHHIYNNGGSYTKDIDPYDTYDSTQAPYHAQLEYGYGNSKFPNVSFVSCMIDGMDGMVRMAETWNKPEPEPNAE